MNGHYLRVQEAAALLEVSPPTIRWYCSQGLLPTYWIGRGQTGHRRFLYTDVADLGRRLGKDVPPEQEWNESEEWNLKRIAEFLGLSGKYLVDSGYIDSSAKLSWDEVKHLEQAVYGQPESSSGDSKEGHNMELENGHDRFIEPGFFGGGLMHGFKNHHRPYGEPSEPGPHPFRGGRGRGRSHGMGRGEDGAVPNPWSRPMSPGAPMPPTQSWQWYSNSVDASDLLMLKSAKRHLEAFMADLQDQLEDINLKIKAHPDNEE